MQFNETKASRKGSNVCCVDKCGSKFYSNKNRDLSFHQFPKEGHRKIMFSVRGDESSKELLDLHKVWKIILNIDETPSTKIKFLRICSLHFKEEDYILPKRGKFTLNESSLSISYNFFTESVVRRKLKLNAVPTENLPSKTNLDTKRPIAKVSYLNFEKKIEKD